MTDSELSGKRTFYLSYNDLDLLLGVPLESDIVVGITDLPIDCLEGKVGILGTGGRFILLNIWRFEMGGSATEPQLKVMLDFMEKELSPKEGMDALEATFRRLSNFAGHYKEVAVSFGTKALA
jgi:hypothetical protein